MVTKFKVGSHVVMYILTDDQGNIGICNFLVAIYERGNLTIRVSEWLLANVSGLLSERIYIVIQYDTYISGIIYGNEMNKKKT
jgi:hypothetical protein